MATVKKDDEKGAIAKVVDKVLHPHANDADADKPKKKKADSAADFNKHPKFNKFKKGT